MSEELIKLLTDCVDDLDAEVDAGWSPDAQSHLRKLRAYLNMHGSAISAQQVPTDPVAERSDDRLWIAPSAIAQFMVEFESEENLPRKRQLMALCRQAARGWEPKGLPIDTAPLSGVRAGYAQKQLNEIVQVMRDNGIETPGWIEHGGVKDTLTVSATLLLWFDALKAGDIQKQADSAIQRITRAADQPDTRPGTPLMLTMETLDLWHQIIHDDSLERGDRLQRIAARINVIQDSVKRAADQVKQSIDTPSMYELMDYPAPVDDSVYSEKGWLIEIGESSYNDLRYQTMINGVRAWTESSEDALRFCRRQDAEKFAAASSLKCRIAEHVWHGKAADQVADQPADAVVVPLDLIKRIDDALGAFTGDEELLNSHIDTYNDVREIRSAREGK